jgi:uncharacterized membrane protein YphA (DoxX/SURF4 family)
MNLKLNAKETAGLLARLAVGGVFIYAGVVKALAPAEEFGYAIEGYRVVSSHLALLTAYVVPWVELYAGLLLVLGIYTRLSALFLGTMLCGFELLLGQAWARRLAVTSCGCFGASHSHSIAHEFAQNVALLALAWAAFKYGGRLSADEAVPE